MKCWIITITGILKLWDILQTENYKYLQARRINSDCLENFFGCIRQQGGSCGKPAPVQFGRAFRKLFCQNYFHTNEMNCLDDLDDLSMNINSENIVDRNTSNISQSLVNTKAISLLDYTYRKENIKRNSFN